VADLHAVEPGRLAVIGLAADVLKFVAVVAGVEQHNLLAELGEEPVGVVDECFVRDAARHLLVDDQSIGRLQRPADPLEQCLVRSRMTPVEKAEIDAGLLPAVEIGLAERYGIGSPPPG